MKIVLAIAAVLMLSACTATGQAALGAAKSGIRAGSDGFADITLSDDCAIPYGAYTRRPLNQRLAIELNCGGNWLETLKQIGVMGGAEVLSDNPKVPASGPSESQ